ncbi:unnamed protein product [Toxocara canis]|uniref:HintC domain-containing protein n=1 Tax=Toxocara canis TaxID=6265 RepID=A0A183UDT4_TOXCA|nr:unnamed protein product [Toxocara canis]
MVRQQCGDDRKFNAAPCTGQMQWTRAVVRNDNGTHKRIRMQCCSFGGMERASELRTVKVLRMGQVYAGGPVQLRQSPLVVSKISSHCSTLKRIALADETDVQRKAFTLNDLTIIVGVENTFIRRLGITGVQSTRMGPVYSGEHFYDNTYPLKRQYPPKTFDARRRPYYKPSVEDYDYYEMEPLSFRRALEKRVRYGARERFWPIANAIKGPYRMLNANKYIPFDGWSIDLKAGDETDYAKVDNDNKRIIIPKNHQSYYAATEVWDDENVERDKRRQGNLNGVFDSLQCFSGDMTIETPDGIREIRSLKTGDKVLSIEGPFVSELFLMKFYCLFSSIDFSYCDIQLGANCLFEMHSVSSNWQFQEGNRQLKLTDFHLIYVTNCQFGEALHLVHSKNLRKGQCLHVIGNDKNFIERARIVNVTRIVQRGIYAPLTATGDIFVNSVLSSCHSNVIVQTLQQTFFALWRHLNSWFLFLTNVGADERTGQLPVGVEYITTVLNILMPVETFM